MNEQVNRDWRIASDVPYHIILQLIPPGEAFLFRVGDGLGRGVAGNLQTNAAEISLLE